MERTRTHRDLDLVSSEDEALRLPEDGFFREVWHNVLVCRDPASSYHGRVGGRLALLLGQYVLHHQLGEVPLSDTGYTVSTKPLTILAPDVSFLRKERFATPLPKGFHPGAPDLAAEIRSPGQSLAELLAKGQAYLAAGCQLVWIIDPERRMAWALRPSEPAGRIQEDGTLSGDPVIPGFRCALRDIFPPTG